MNLLLYTESKHILARQRGEPVQTTQGKPTDIWNTEQLPSLPDSLFEELGYFGALDEDEADKPEEESGFEELFHWLAEPAPAFHH